MDIVISAVMDMDGIETAMKSKVIKAINKVIWIQNDLFARHYIPEVEEMAETNGVINGH